MPRSAAPLFTDWLTPVATSSPVPPPSATRPPARIQIENVTPQLDCGRYAVKRAQGDPLDVAATIFRDGHEQLRAAVRYRAAGARTWQEAPMRHVEADRWIGSFLPGAGGTGGEPALPGGGPQAAV